MDLSRAEQKQQAALQQLQEEAKHMERSSQEAEQAFKAAMRALKKHRVDMTRAVPHDD